MAPVVSSARPIPFSPLSRRLCLGDELRRLRQEQGFTTGKAAGLVPIDRTLLTRIETGQRRVKVDQVMSIVEALGVGRDHGRWQEFHELARDADTTGWWETAAFRDMGSRQMRPADLEAGACRIRWYDFVLVPGLLQAASYIEALHGTALSYRPSFDRRAAIKGRLRRQQEVFRPGGPRIEAILEETVIRRQVVPADAMLEQLHHLLEIMDARVMLRVLPVGGRLVGVRPPRSPCTLYDFGTGDPPISVAEALTEDVLLRDTDSVASHEQLWSGLERLALSPEDTRALIAGQAATLAREGEAGR